jgi:Xaa-Pro aminopeptidase
MVRDSERIARIQRTLETHQLDALVCSLPSNVRLASGYWPVIGNAIAVAARDGVVAVLAPHDEAEFATDGWADVLRFFSSGSLATITNAVDAVRPHIAALFSSAGLRPTARVGIEGASFDPSVYAAGFSYGASLPALLTCALPRLEVVDATDALARLRSTLTSHEIASVREACAFARTAFEYTARQVRAGLREYELADILRARLRVADRSRADGFVYCMSGPNGGQAHASFQQSTGRAIAEGESLLLHCNSCCAGMWTDITRTFFLGSPPRPIRARLDAILRARRDAIDAVAAGVSASAVDLAARRALAGAGFESEFRHPAGHGVGFAAIDHNAVPRLHPHSSDVLETGMVFNIEPAVYEPGAFGIRHCDMVAVTPAGAELLTGFQQSPEDLLLPVQ